MTADAKYSTGSALRSTIARDSSALHLERSHEGQDKGIRMGSYKFNLKEWPLVLLVADGDITPAQADQHFVEYRQVLNRNLPYGLVFDATTVGTVDASLRKKYAEFLKENDADLRRLCKGCGFVITSAVIRGALTAVLWLTDLPFEYKVFSSRGEAREWVQNRLR